MPLAWLLGAMTICLIATFAGMKLSKPGAITLAMRAILGVAVGSAFTPELNERLIGLSFSLAFLLPYCLITALCGYYFFKKIGRFDRPTAFYSAMPGGFQDMVAFGEEAGAKLQPLALVHATRIIILVFTLPFLVSWIEGFSVDRNAPYTWPAHQDLAILFACGAGGWFIAKMLRISGAAIVGPMIASGIVHYLGITEATAPRLFMELAQLIIGVHIGCQYQGMKLKEMGYVMALSLAYLCVLGIITVFFVFCASFFATADPIAALLAFSPGGQAEMNLIAFAMDIDMTYVALHHLIRMVIVIVGAQVMFKLLTSFIK
ncbi:AbrB family transcriptional regulator [Terasakiella sp. SH-1]|uniref:AbrB family transcriptional regulator n=1 Tax=Terasakiella sp. SH-1 TaxID=2560057 RepID=UPI0014303AE2|nr:AbrB family transcriptional regulator [Terasakiella sp. SH-1]